MSFSLGKFFPKKDPLNEPFLELNSPLWRELEGAYRGVKYDTSVALRQLDLADSIQEVKRIYAELWNELHHQGDVGEASYYAVPHLVRIAQERHLFDYNVFSLVSVIEIQRHKNNPALPKAFEPSYHKAIGDLGELAKLAMQQNWDLDLASSVLTAIALTKGQLKLANAILNMDSDDIIDEFLEQY